MRHISRQLEQQVGCNSVSTTFNRRSETIPGNDLRDKMAQNRCDGPFNPPSPHSSSGGAESYKGTPDTRLTAFSPDEGSAKSTRLLTALRLANTEIQPVRFPVNPYGGSAVTGGKDPFVTSTGGSKPGQKLSPTATAFRPFTGQPASRLSADFAADGRLLPRDSLFRVSEHQLARGVSITAAETGITRCLAILSVDGSAVLPADVHQHLKVRLGNV